MNKDYLKILLVPLICILIIFLKPIYIATFGETVELKGLVNMSNQYDYYDDHKSYIDLDIKDIENEPSKWDKEMYAFMKENFKNKEDVSFRREKGYVVLENVNGVYETKRLTFEKPKGEIYLKCDIVYDYDNWFYVSYDNVNDYVRNDKIRLGKSIQVEEESYYDDSVEVIEYKEAYIKIKVLNGEVLNH